MMRSPETNPMPRVEGERGHAGQGMQDRAAVRLLEPSMRRPPKKCEADHDVPSRRFQRSAQK
jgi:hypothetical protein